jgi:leucine efflux protein
MNSFGIIDLPTYLVGTLIIVLLPGPNSLFVLSTAAARGVAAGYRAASGVFVGDAVLMVMAAGGVASLLKAYPAAFLAFKYVGAAYLAWIGVSMLRGAWRGRLSSPEDPERTTSPMAASPGDPFRRALVISLLNPKAILFFMAFFIQFVDPAYAHSTLSFVILGAIAQIMSLTYLSALIFSGARLAGAFRRRQRLSAGLTGGAGALFVGFGAKLATASLS